MLYRVTYNRAGTKQDYKAEVNATNANVALAIREVEQVRVRK